MTLRNHWWRHDPSPALYVIVSVMYGFEAYRLSDKLLKCSGVLRSYESVQGQLGSVPEQLGSDPEQFSSTTEQLSRNLWTNEVSDYSSLFFRPMNLWIIEPFLRTNEPLDQLGLRTSEKSLLSSTTGKFKSFIAVISLLEQTMVDGDPEILGDMFSYLYYTTII